MQKTSTVESLITQSLRELPKDRRLEFADVLTVSMHAVELLQQITPDALKQSGADKRRLAKDLAWQVLEVARREGFITREELIALQGYFSLAADILDGLINAFHFIKKHPTYIQIEEAVATKCAGGCLGKRNSQTRH